MLRNIGRKWLGSVLIHLQFLNLVISELIFFNLQHCAHIGSRSLSENEFPVNLKAVIDHLRLKLI
jgi:hypothetical protein